MKQIYNTTFWEEAEFIRILLRDHGIPSTLDNQGGALYAIGIPTSTVPFGISVAAEKAQRAAEIIRDYLKKRNEPQTLSDEEDRKFKEDLESWRRRRRWIWGLAWIGPNVCALLLIALFGLWEAAIAGATYSGLLVGLALVMGSFTDKSRS